MSAEHGDRPKKRTKKETYAEVLKQLKKQTEEDIKRIRPILEKDPDWLLVSGQKELLTNEDCRRDRRALTRLTKKAANLLLPQFKTLSCYGTGTTQWWVYVNILIPEKLERLPKEAIEHRVRMMLESVGLKYNTYLPDALPGKDEPTPCLSVRVNDLNWGHY